MARLVVFGLGPMRWETSTRLFALALRSWHFAHTLARGGHSVLLISIRGQAWEGWPPDKITRVERDGVTVLSVSEHLCHERPEWIAKQIRTFRPDAMVGVNRDPAAIAVNFAQGLPLWADINGDPMAEAQVKASSLGGDWNINDWYRKFVPVLLRADHMSTCSQAQKHALVGQLGMLGRLTSANDGYDFVTAIPNSIDDDELALFEKIARRPRSPGEPFVLLWSGGYNTWTDPDVLFEALELAMGKVKQLRFVSTGGAIPGHHTSSYERFVRRVEGSRFRDRIELAGWVQTAELPAYYASAHAAILVDRFCYEGLLGARTRALDWLAAGLPIVCTRLSEISIELEQAGAALTTPCGDRRALRDAIVALHDDPKDAFRRGELGRRHARERLRAELSLAPLLSWAARPTRAPGAEQRVDLHWEPGPIATFRNHASLVRSELSERGARATALAVGRFALRRVRTGAARLADRFVSDAPSSTIVEARVGDAAPTEAPQLAGFEWRERYAKLERPPAVTVLVLVEPDTAPHVLGWTLDQVRTQYFPAKSVLIVELGEPTPALDEAIDAQAALLRSTSKLVERVCVSEVELGLQRSLAGSDWVLTLPAGQLLRPDTLAELCWAAESGEGDVIYADEQRIDETNVPLPPDRKPGWMEDLFLARPYLGSVVLIKRQLFEPSAERARSWPAEAIVYDTLLRATDCSPRVHHIARVLSQRWTPQQAADPARVEREQLRARCHQEAVQDALWRRGQEARIERGPRPGVLRLRFPESRKRVAVMIIGAGDPELDRRCLDSLERFTPERYAELSMVRPRRASSDQLRLSGTNRADWIVLLDARVEAFRPDWLSALLEQAQRKGVAGVSPKLLYPSGAVAFGGNEAPAWLEHAVHEPEQLTAACVAVPASAFAESVIPLDLAERASWLRALTTRWQKSGRRLLFTPYSLLYVHGVNGELRASHPPPKARSGRERGARSRESR